MLQKLKCLYILITLGMLSFGAYGASERELPKALEEARSLVQSDATELQTIQACISQLEKLSSDTHDSELLAEACQLSGQLLLFNMRNSKQALPWFRKAAEAAPEDWSGLQEVELSWATLLATSEPQTDGASSRAEEILKRLIDRNPSSESAIRARILLGRMAELILPPGRKPNLEEAREHYRKALDLGLTEDVETEVLLYLCDSKVRESFQFGRELGWTWEERVQRVESAIKELKPWLKKNESSGLVPGIWEYLGKVYLKLGNTQEYREKGLECYLNATGDEGMLQGEPPIKEKTQMDKVDGGYFFWKIGNLAKILGYREIAFEYFTRQRAQYPEYRSHEALLQAEVGLGYSRDEIKERLREHYRILGRPELIIDQMIRELKWLPPRWDNSELPSPTF